MKAIDAAQRWRERLGRRAPGQERLTRQLLEQVDEYAPPRAKNEAAFVQEPLMVVSVAEVEAILADRDAMIRMMGERNDRLRAVLAQVERELED